jgi:aminoglycoside phosphotransferase
MTVFQKVAALLDETKILTHGDLYLLNIIVDGNSKIAGIVDCGTSGFSIKKREYFETRSRAGDGNWAAATDAIFQCDTTNEIYTLLNESNTELVVYTGY